MSFISQLQASETRNNNGFLSVRKEIAELQGSMSSAQSKLIAHEHKFVDTGERLKSHQRDLAVLTRNVGNLEASKLDVKKGAA